MKPVEFFERAEKILATTKGRDKEDVDWFIQDIEELLVEWEEDEEDE